MGALPVLSAATADDVDGGDVGPGGLLNRCGAPEKQEPSAAFTDEGTADRLWDMSAELTGVTYDLPDA